MLFEEALLLTRNDGLHITMHCDMDQEYAAGHVHKAIFDICNGAGTERIDYGLNAIDREDLIPGLTSRGIGLTISACLSPPSSDRSCLPQDSKVMGRRSEVLHQQ